MTRQEEIREGIQELIFASWDKPVRSADLAWDIIVYLHSQGVRRMKDELPIITKKGWYHLVEPLIEEEQDVLQH